MPQDIVVKKDLRERLSDLAGSRRDAWLIAAVIALLVVASVALFRRSATAVIAPPALPATTASPAEGAQGAIVAVHVAGAVRKPGLYELRHGERVADAIAAAGGPTRSADLNALNLAEPLADGVQVYIARRGEQAAAAPTGTPAPAASPGAPAAIDINSADAIALEQIPGIGPVRAQAIIEYRSEIGSFDSVDQLLEVTGIGPATLESMRPYVTL
jgi:competence protein ComEA